MKQLQLQKLEISDFMGIEDFQFNPKGEDCRVLGENATGKSTLLSGFLWLLFGENNRRSSRFDIKPVTKPEAEATVTGKFKLDGEEFTVTRKYGDNYEYAVNEVPKKKSEYDQFLKDKLDLEKLRILVSARYFNDGLGWQERRAILMNLVEGVEAEDIIEANSELEELDLQGLEPEDRRDQLKSEIKELEEEKKNIPVQIQTLQENAPEFEDEEPEDIEDHLGWLEDEKEKLQDTKQNLDEQIVDLKSSGQQAELRRKRDKLTDEITKFERDWKREYNDKLESVNQQKDDFWNSFDQVKRKMEDKEQEKEKAQERIKELDKRREHLRERWHEIREQKFDGEVCPVCEQEIPEEGLEEVRKKINADKAQKIEEIQEQGHKKKDQQEKLEDEVDCLTTELGELQEERNDLEEELDNVDERIEKLEKERAGFDAQDGYKELEEERNEVIEKLESEDSGSSDKLKEKKEQLKDLKKEIDEQNEAIAQAKEYRRSLSKVGQLKAKESELAAKLETLKNQKRLVDEFVKTKANMLEDSINSKFDLVDFKLFEEYKSKDGVKETCQTMVQGVSWSTLNNGARIMGGLDIISTLNEKYGLKAPIWIDNSESITHIPKNGSHQIELEVEEGVNELEVKDG